MGFPLVETLAGTKWTIRGGALPRGTRDATFAAVSCPAVGYCVLAGQFDSPSTSSSLFESWNGRAFTLMKAPEEFTASAGVSCVSMRSCVAVDDLINVDFSATSYAQVWNGRAWSSTVVPWPKQIPNGGLNADSCAGGRCMGVGATGLVGGIGATGAEGRAGAVLFNGTKWAMTSFPAPPAGDVSQLFGVSCVSATFCVAVGVVGPSSGLVSAALTAVWNGKSWKLVTAP
jgi:hypothetical protein